MIIIDPPLVSRYDRLWSHLASDVAFAELHDFAAKLGIPQRAFDRDHYDVPSLYYHDAVAMGATSVTSRELVRRLIAADLRRRKPPRSHAAD